MAFKTNTWKKYSLLVLRGLIDSINFLWQIRPECSNKKRTCGFSSGVHSPPHESEQNRKIVQGLQWTNSAAHLFLITSGTGHMSMHTHTHMRTHTLAATHTWNSSLTEEQTHLFRGTLLEELHHKLHAGLLVKLLHWLLPVAFCIRAKFILCFEYTNKLIYTAFKLLEPSCCCVWSRWMSIWHKQSFVFHELLLQLLL